MAQITPQLAEIIKKYHPDPKSAVWDCHGHWIAYHKALEVIARTAKIEFGEPIVLEANGSAGCVALCVTGKMNGQSEWSIGEAAPSNNKNAYPFAMAEKRAKDRVILKLIGLHGEVYSEEEADDFKPSNSPPPRQRTVAEWRKEFAAIDAELKTFNEVDGCRAFIMGLGGAVDRHPVVGYMVQATSGLLFDLAQDKPDWWAGSSKPDSPPGLQQRMQEKLNAFHPDPRG